MKTQTETGMTHLQVKEHQGLTVGGHQKLEERHEMDSPPELPGRTNPAIPGFQFLAS